MSDPTKTPQTESEIQKEPSAGFYRMLVDRAVAFLLALGVAPDKANYEVEEALANATEFWRRAGGDQGLFSSYFWSSLFARHPDLGIRPPPQHEPSDVEILLGAIRELSRKEREVVFLKFEGKLTNKQIAEVLGISDLNVRIVLNRAIKQLRERLPQPSTKTEPISAILGSAVSTARREAEELGAIGAGQTIHEQRSRRSGSSRLFALWNSFRKYNRALFGL